MTPILVAHRGYMLRYPENTLTGIRAAIDAGACMVEFDVQMTGEHEFVLLHDDDFKRTSNVTGTVFEYSILNPVSVHEPKRFQDRFSGETVPTLMQALDTIAAYPDVTAVVEVKEESLQQWGTETVMSKLVNILESARARCLVISFDADAVDYVKKYSKLQGGWVLKHFDTNSKQQAQQLSPDYLICNYKKINSELWKGDWQWMLYDIMQPDLALEWANKGAALIETSDIGGILNHPVLGKKACGHGA